MKTGERSRARRGANGAGVVVCVRARVRRVAKWAGLVVCALIAALWAVNYWWNIAYWSCGPDSPSAAAAVSSGVFFFVAPAPTEAYSGWATMRNPSGYMFWPLEWEVGERLRLVLPLWMPFLAAALPTGWLWSRDRRWGPGRCVSCGYDLAGLAAGAPCPECGKVSR